MEAQQQEGKGQYGEVNNVVRVLSRERSAMCSQRSDKGSLTKIRCKKDRQGKCSKQQLKKKQQPKKNEEAAKNKQELSGV